ncbi:MAG: Phosphoglucosamine mutase [Syntrophus sp. PtaB.Bin001]|nr:MAG: Phosphoglucosamine mutase [Syntrophus sp. PtaB.Bin001]
MRADAGIVISASHNPIQDSGIKIFSGEGYKLPDEKELEIEKIVLSDVKGKTLSPYELGRAFRMEDARGRYIVFLKHTFPKEYMLEGRRFVLDCANGATYRVAPETFRELGAEVIPLFNEPDGRNINVNCGSQHPEKLAEAVVRHKADAGFAFDGDGDRLIAVDETGVVLTGDQVIALCAKIMKEEGRLNGNLVVRTVMSNVGLTAAFQELGIDSVMAGVGDRFVLEEMVARGAVLGGEDSGHIIFREFHTTGDGILTALQVAAAMVKEGKTLSELAKIMTVYPQNLINLDVCSKPDLSSIPEVVSVIEAVEKQLADRGRVLVRYSGTQNMCRVMVEGPTREETEIYCRRIADVIRAKIG